MDAKEIETKIRDILKDEHIIKKPIDEIKNTESFINDLGLDSIGMVTALTAIEKIFNIEIPPEDFVLDNFGTIQKTVNYLLKKV